MFKLLIISIMLIACDGENTTETTHNVESSDATIATESDNTGTEKASASASESKAVENMNVSGTVSDSKEEAVGVKNTNNTVNTVKEETNANND